MPIQVDGFTARAMSGTELSRVRTEFRLRPLERINQSLLESRGPTLLCNQVESVVNSGGQMSGRASLELWSEITQPVSLAPIRERGVR